MSFLSKIFSKRDGVKSFEEITSTWGHGVYSGHGSVFEHSEVDFMSYYDSLYGSDVSEILELYLENFEYKHVPYVNPLCFGLQSEDLKSKFFSFIHYSSEDYVKISSYNGCFLPLHLNVLPGPYLIKFYNKVVLSRMDFIDAVNGDIPLYDDTKKSDSYDSFEWYLSKRFDAFFKSNKGKIDGEHYASFFRRLAGCIARKHLELFKRHIDTYIPEIKAVDAHLARVKAKRNLYLRNPNFLFKPENCDVILDEATFVVFLTHNSGSRLHKILGKVFPSLRYEDVICEKDIYNIKFNRLSYNEFAQEQLTDNLINTLEPTIFYYENLYDNDMLPLLKNRDFAAIKAVDVDWASPKSGNRSMSPYRNFQFLGDAFEMPYFYEDRIYKIENELYSTALLKLIVYVNENMNNNSGILLFNNKLNIGTINKIIESLDYYKDKNVIDDEFYNKVLNSVN